MLVENVEVTQNIHQMTKVLSWNQLHEHLLYTSICHVGNIVLLKTHILLQLFSKMHSSLYVSYNCMTILLKWGNVFKVHRDLPYWSIQHDDYKPTTTKVTWCIAKRCNQMLRDVMNSFLPPLPFPFLSFMYCLSWGERERERERHQNIKHIFEISPTWEYILCACYTFCFM